MDAQAISASEAGNLTPRPSPDAYALASDRAPAREVVPILVIGDPNAATADPGLAEETRRRLQGPATGHQLDVGELQARGRRWPRSPTRNIRRQSILRSNAARSLAPMSI